jgi:RNA polymerase sigma factor (sigma-70 family)
METKSQQRIVYLVDDDEVVLKMLQAMVATIGVNVQAYSSSRAFIATYRPSPCECLVCDIRMPDMDGMELQKQLETMNATLPIIFLTGYAEVGIAVEAMKRGAFDFIEKPFSAQFLLNKIQAALESSKLRRAKLLEDQAITARMALLTPRERNIIQYVIAGQSSREISEKLGISVRTVENHRARILEKLHVESTVELIKLFI